MKKELSPGIVIGVIAALVVVVVAFFVIGTGGLGGTKPVSPKELSPEELADADPPRPGQPGYVGQ